MEKLRKLFGGIQMTWLKVIIYSVVTGIIVGALMVPAFLKDTSFQDPGITMEFWILFALIIIMNCDKPLEAGLKTFVAFLISQPIIYLVQVPFSKLGFGLFTYYPYWFKLTLLTFPGGIIAWYVKKGNWLSVAILSVANLILCVMIPGSVVNLISNFPHHLLAIIFMVLEVVLFILIFFKEKKKRIVAFIIAFIMLLGGCVYEYMILNGDVTFMVFADGEGPYTVEYEDERTDVSFTGSMVVISYKESDFEGEGDFYTIYKDAEGNEYRVDISYKDGELYLKD